jgi:maltose alpha-D-glucosyltransferase/alpha-amylase
MREGVTLLDEGRLVFALENGTIAAGTTSQRLGASVGAQRWIVDDARLVTLHRQMPRVRDSAVASLRHLREQGFAHVPELLGTAVVVDADGEAWVAATSQRYVSHPIDAEGSLRALLLAGTADLRLFRSADAIADALAALHRAFAAPGNDPTFGAFPLSDDDVARWRAGAFADLDALVAAGVEGVIGVRDRAKTALDALPAHIDARSSRAHGRLTLRRVLLVDGAPFFVGFGESVEDRSSPLVDVASLARSFDSVTREAILARAHDPTSDPSATSARMRDLAATVLSEFLARYAAATGDLATVPRDPHQRDALIRFFRVRAALRDVRDALARRPAMLAAAVDALALECP